VNALRLMPQTASVYTAAPVGGAFSVLAKSGLRCQLAHVGGAATSAPERAELAAVRVLYFDPAYSLPSDHCQVEVRGERWNVVPGTVTDQRDQRDVLCYRKCDLTRNG
jgi:hypothetical protein